MKHLEQVPQHEEQISRGLAVSLAVHAILLSFFTLKAVFFDPEPIDFSQAVRVDIVGLPEKVDPKSLAAPAKEEAKPALPDKEKPAPAPPAPVTQKTETAKVEQPTPTKSVPVKASPKKNDEGLNLEKVKSQQQSAIEKLKTLAALEKIKEEAANEKKSAGSGKSDISSQKIKGNILSPGTALTGLAKLQHDTYAADLDRHIKQNWSLPEWLAKRDFKAQAKVYIDSHGNILDRKIVKSSGNPSYDEEVLATIDRSAPFPVPPEKFLAIVSVNGILIGFPE